MIIILGRDDFRVNLPILRYTFYYNTVLIYTGLFSINSGIVEPNIADTLLGLADLYPVAVINIIP